MTRPSGLRPAELRALGGSLVLSWAPGSRKGTQAPSSPSSSGVPHLASGDLFRAAVASGSAARTRGRRGYMERGAARPRRHDRPDASSTGSPSPTPRRARSSTASRARAAQAEALDAALGRARRARRRRAATSRSRRGPRPPARRPLDLPGRRPRLPPASNPPRVPGRLRHRRLAARTSAPTTSRGDGPGPAGPAAAAALRGGRPLPADRASCVPVDGDQPIDESSTRTSLDRPIGSPDRGA